MRTATIMLGVTLFGVTAIAQACPYGDKTKFRATEAPSATIKTYVYESDKQQTPISVKTPLKGDIVTTVEPKSEAN